MDFEELIRRARNQMTRDILGVALDLFEVAELLGDHPLEIAKRLAEKSILGISREGMMWFPLWQFDGPYVMAGLPRVLRTLKGDARAKAHWLQTPNECFEGKSPIEILRSGRIEWVAREAAALSKPKEEEAEP